MTQFSKAATCAAQWKMGLFEVFFIIYLTAVCAAQDPQDEPPVPVLQLQSAWLDVFPSEKVELNCSVGGSSDWIFTWYRNEEQLNPASNLSFPGDGSVLTFTAGSNPQIYTCKGQHKTTSVLTQRSNPLTLKVYANTPKPVVTRTSNFDKMFPRESITFNCRVNVSSGWEYLWYHNSQDILPSNSNEYTIPDLDHSHSGQYFCKAKRGKDSSFSTEASETTSLQVSDPPTPTLKLLSPWLDVFEEELVELRCEVNNPDWTITWYKNRVEVREDSVLYMDEDETLLNITSVSQTHQGEYACRANLPSRVVSSKFSNTANVTVYENIPKPTLSKQPAINSMYAGETVHFTCKVDFASGWKYQWYKNEHELTDTSKTISILLDVSDGGEYSCKATRSERTSTTNSEKIRQGVLEIPVPSLKPVTQWLDVFPTESVMMSCEMQVSSDWTYTWYKDEKELQAVDTVLFGTDGNLSISSASSSHRGKYSCSAKLKSRSVSSNHSSPLTLTVYDKKPTVTLKQDPEYKVMFSTESVTFTCHIDVSSEWKYMWYKDGNQLVTTANTYSISHIGTQHGGSYKCQVKRGILSLVFTTDFSQPIHLQVEANMPKPLMTQQPDVEKLYTGELVNFECTVKVSSGWTYQWNKDGAHVLTNSSTFQINGTRLSDSGTYECDATRDQTLLRTDHSDGRTLHISEIPVPSLKPVTQWLDVFPTESVKLSCGMQVSSDWTYTWYKDEKELQADTVLFGTDGTTLSISSASSSHRGKYSCSAKLKSRSVSSNHSSPLTLTVYDKKPTVTLKQDPEYKVMFSTESVTFTCHIDVSSEWKYMWYKDGNQLVTTANTYSISHIGTQHGGSYKCQVKRGILSLVFTTDFSQPIHLQVEANTPKPLMTQQPDVEKLYTGELVNFECTVKISSGWTYQWNKDGAHVLTNSSTFQINGTRLSDSGTYECDATRDQTLLRTDHSDGRTLHISEIPVPSLKPVTQWLDVFPTESVKLSCGMQVSSDWTYTWYKDEKELQADTVLFGTDGTTLSISSASSSHRGKYSCSAKLKSRSVSSNHSLHLTLDVYDTKPRVMLMQDPTHSLMHTGDSVSFSCHINVSSGWKYLWHKDGSPFDQFGNNYNISSVATTHTGSYECQATRGTSPVWHSEKSQPVRLDVEERPQASIILLTGWSEVFSTDSLVLRCEVMKSSEMWNYTWFKEGQRMDPVPSEKYVVTPQNDPEQSLYTCQGNRIGRPSYSKSSESFKTQNLLLKRRVLLSISGCLFFGIIAVFFGCIILRVIRKPDDDDDKPEEANLFLTMAQLKDCADAPYPLAEYITDADLNALPKEGDENGTICSETTPLPITLQEDQAVLTDVQKTTENNGGLVSFQQ